MRLSWKERPAALWKGALRLSTTARPHLRPVFILAGALCGSLYLILLALAPPEFVPQHFKFANSAAWITTNDRQQATGCFRLDLWVPGTVVNAWVALASNGGFEVLANGESCARDYSGSPISSYQEALSLSGQRLRTEQMAISVQIPREFQWAHHDTTLLPSWVDLTANLQQGHNTLCVEVETPGTTPAMILAGEVRLATGEVIPIASGQRWVAEPVPLSFHQENWTMPEWSVYAWSHARVLDWRRTFWRLVPKGVFEEPFHGKRIRFDSRDPTTWLEDSFNLADKPREGFLRVVTDTAFQIWINGELLKINSRTQTAFAKGPWFIREISRGPLDSSPEATAEWLDPGEVATLLPGDQGENSLRGSNAPSQIRPDPKSVSGTAENPFSVGERDASSDTFGSGHRGKVNPYTDVRNPDSVLPPALTRSSRHVEYLAFSVTPLLRQGRNTIRIGLYKDPPEAIAAAQRPFFAFDGGAQLADGHESSFESDASISSFSGKTPKLDLRPVRTDTDGDIQPSLLPTKVFFGAPYPKRRWFSLSAGMFVLFSGFLLVGATRAPGVAFSFRKIQMPAAVMLGWILAGLLLRTSMLERSEAVFLRFPLAPLLLLATGMTGALVAAILGRYCDKEKLKAFLKNYRLRAEALRRKWGWAALIGLVVLVCFVLRAWQIDFQPPDDDEYASIQAALAISKTGLPQFQPGVWYTRSPLYHYLAGAVAFVSGGNIYGLRLLSVFFSCASALLVWKMTRDLTCNRALALSTLVLYTIHPFAIFTGHVARFYQQQEFFHLLGLFFFIRGFIMNTGMRDRYLAVLIFLAAVLSQEITALQILPLAVCWALFGQRRSWPDEIRILVAVGCALAIIGLDYAFFRIDCLTALEGASVRIEARIGWWFDKSANFFALLVGYSRLHIVLSAFLIPGFVIAWRRQKTVWIALYVYFFLSILVTNLLITNKGFRYEYYLIPVWILLCIQGLGECTRLLIPGWRQFPARAALGAGWILMVACSWSPWRVLDSYNVSIGADPTRALRYVAENLRPGDRIATSEPLPDAALLEAGQADYDLSFPILYDFLLREKGILVDRNAGAQALGNLDELQQACAHNDRVWVVCSRELTHSRGERILWQFSGGRVQLFLRNNARLLFRSYRYNVYLWDRNAGRYSSFREKPPNWFE